MTLRPVEALKKMSDGSVLKPEEAGVPPVNKNVPIGEAAKILGVSEDQVRQLQSQELLKESSPGLFNTADLERIATKQGLSLAEEATQVGIGLQRAIATTLNVVRVVVTTAFAGAVAYGLIVAGFVVAYSYFPNQVASWINQKNPSPLQAILQPEGTVALGILKYAQPSQYKEATQNIIVNPNDIFTIGRFGSLTPTGPLVIPTSRYLNVVTTGLIANLNAQYLQGRTPGTATGNVAIIGQVQGLADNVVNTNNIVDGQVQNADLATITDSNKVSGSAVQLNGNGGLTNNSGLSLLTSCSDTQVLQWNASSSKWECATGTGGGSGITTIREGGATVVNPATSIDFAASDFNVTEPSAGVGDIAIDYTNSKIVRSDQNESITGAWTFNTLTSTGNVFANKGPDFGTTGTLNDFNFGNGSLFRFTGSGAATLTGIANGSDGRFIELMNASSSNITISNEDSGSSASNRILTQTAGNVTIAANSSVGFQYDSGASRWRIVTTPVTPAALGNTVFVQGGNGFGTTATLGTTDANALDIITGNSTRFAFANGSSTLTGTGATTLTSTGTLALNSASGSTLTVDSGGTGALNFGTGANVKTITLGNVTGATAFNVNTGTGGTTYTTTNGIFTLNTGTGAINLGTDAVAKTITIGNVTGATSVVINSGTGNINIGTGAEARTVNLGTGAAAQTVTVGSASGGSSLTLDSGTGALNIGTSIAKTITLGNVTGATAVDINAGSGGGSFISSSGLDFNPYGTSAGNTSEVRFSELAANGSNYVGFKAPDSLAGNVIWTLPNTDGSNGTVLTTNGAGALTWSSSGACPTCFTNGGNTFAATADLGTNDLNDLNLRTNSLTRITVLSGGNVGIGDTTPAALLTVGSGDKFQVDSNGNILKINNVTTSFPASQGAASTVLTNDGAGNLTWSSVGAGTSSLDAITAALGTASINNTNFNIAWNWKLTGATDGFDISEPGGAASTGTGYLLRAATIATSTAKPFSIGARGTTIFDTTAAGGLTIGDSATLNTPVTIQSGTGAINIGTDAVAHIVTIGNVTGATSLVLNAGTGNIDIGTTAQARSINLGTGGAAQAVTVGSTNDASTLTLDSGTGALNIGTTIAKVITIGNSTGVTAVDLTSGSGGINFDGSTSVTGSNTFTTGTGDTTINSTLINLAGASPAIDLSGGGTLGLNTTNNAAITTGTGLFTTGGGLTVDGAFTASGNFITPKGSDFPTTGTSTDVDFGTGSLFRYTGGAAATINGIAGGTNGRIIRIVNDSSPASTLTIGNNAGTAANRVLTQTGSDLALSQYETVTLQYDSGDSRWKVMAFPVNSTALSGFAFVQGGNSFGATAVLGTNDAQTMDIKTGGNVRFSLANPVAGTSTITGNGITTYSSSGTLTLSSAAASGLTITSGTTGNVVINSGTTGAIQIGNDTDNETIQVGTGAGVKQVTLGSTNTTSTTTIASGTSGIGIGDFNNTKQIRIGGNIFDGADTIRISTDGTTADTLTFGNSNAATAFTLTGGTAWSISSAGALTVSSVTDSGLSTNGVVTNTAAGLLGTLAGTTTTVLHGNAAGLPAFSSITGSDLAANITISTTGNISTTGTGTITSAGLLTASNGFTISTGALAFNTTSGTLSATGLTALTETLTSGTAAITAPTLNLNTAATGNTAIGNATGTFALTSNGGLNVTTGGALTGVASLDTISTSATALTFAGAGTIATTNSTLTLSSGTGDINIGTTTQKNIQIGNSSGTTSVNITSGSGNINLLANGTSTGNVQIGDGGAASATPDLLVLDVGSAEPTGTNGGMYYSTSTNTFRCYQNGAWKDCDTNVNNIKSTTSTAAANVTNAITSFASVTITPSSTSKNVWITASMSVFDNNVAISSLTFSIWKGATCAAPSTLIGDANGVLPVKNATNYGNASLNFIDAPNTTSATTYQLCAVSSNAGPFPAETRTITAMEVTLGADLAEVYNTLDNSITSGDLVSVDSSIDGGVKKTTSAYQNDVVGVISTNPGMVLSGPSGAGKPVMVALSGRIPVKVSTENGSINPGDYLTTSSIPGVAMKATKAGSIVGTAMGSYSGDGVGTVIAFAKNGTTNGAKLADLLPGVSEGNYGQTLLTQMVSASTDVSPSESLSDVSTDRLAAAIEVITPKLTAKDINLTGTLSLLGSDGAQNVIIDSLGNATFAGTINADTIYARQIKGLSLFTNSISTLENKVNELATASATPAPTTTPLAIVDLINGMFRKAAEFFGNVIFHGDVTIMGRPTFNKDTAGFATLTAGQNEVDVNFDKEYVNTPVVTASVNLVGGVNVNDVPSYAIYDITTKGFKIKMSRNAGFDMQFSWIALSVKDANTTQGTVSGASTTQGASSDTTTPSASPVPTEVPQVTPTPSPSPVETVVPTESPVPTASPLAI